jgi:hypothetical protein
MFRRMTQAKDRGKDGGRARSMSWQKRVSSTQGAPPSRARSPCCSEASSEPPPCSLGSASGLRARSGSSDLRKVQAGVLHA